MIRRFVIPILVASIVQMTASDFAFAGSRKNRDQTAIEKIRNKVAKLGTGPKAHVTVRLNDKTEVRGHISQISDMDFVVVTEESGAAKTITYDEVHKLKGPASLTKKIVIGAVVGVVAFVGIYAAAMAADNS